MADILNLLTERQTVVLQHARSQGYKRSMPPFEHNYMPTWKRLPDIAEIDDVRMLNVLWDLGVKAKSDVSNELLLHLRHWRGVGKSTLHRLSVWAGVPEMALRHCPVCRCNLAPSRVRALQPSLQHLRHQHAQGSPHVSNLPRAIHFDMETADPDDVMTLALLATHPQVNLIGVTLTPGGREQYSLIRHVLGLMGRSDVPVGSADPDRTKPCVSEFHYNWLGTPSIFAGTIPTATDVLQDTTLRYSDATFLTGAPLKNYGAYPGRPFFKRWVGQGGFAGDSVVPPEDRLPKFAGMETCPTFNLNGDVKAALAILQDHRIEERILVSKNVCHGVAWDQTFHQAVKALKRRTDGLELCLMGMDRYLAKKPQGKLLHDPLAMTVAISTAHVTLAQVEVYREKGAWGSRWDESVTGESLNAWITIRVLKEKFFEVLTQA